jgi:hypothetical protein
MLLNEPGNLSAPFSVQEKGWHFASAIAFIAAAIPCTLKTGAH